MSRGCDLAPCVQVNHRFFGPLDNEGFNALIDALASGRTMWTFRDMRAQPRRAARRSRGERCSGRELDSESDHAMITNAEPIITRRARLPDSYTLERYTATGGYDGLRKALSLSPQEVAAEVDERACSGEVRGFPAGRKWSMLAPGEERYSS